MAEGTIAAYNLGKIGVVVDKSLVHAEDGELTKAQNTIHDKHGSDGGIVNREGLLKDNAVAAAGSILGFVSVPLGPGPGAGTDDALVYYLSNTAGAWFKSTNSFSTSSSVSTLAATANTVDSAMFDGRLYYVSGTTIRVFDGIVDSLHSNVGGSFILGLNATGGSLYVAVQSGSTGFVYAVDAAGRLTQIGAALPSSYLPHFLLLHQNDLYATCTKSGSASTVYRIRVDTATSATAWTLDYTSSVDYSLPSMASFLGLLYLAENTPDTTASKVYQRSTGGTYSAVDTGGSSSGANSLLVYRGKLYAHWDHEATNDSSVRRTSDGSTWADVLTYTPSTAAGLGVLRSTGGKIFALGQDQTLGHYSDSGDSADWTQYTTATAGDAAFGFFNASGTGPAFGATASFVVLQGGTSLQIKNQAGTLITLTMPTGITLDASRPPRFAVFDKYVVLANTPSRPITIDAQGIVRPLAPLPPVKMIELDDDGGAGGLTGDYKARQTFLIRDEAGNIIAESDFSPVMDVAFAASSDTLDAEALNLSPETSVDGSRIYRTAAGGSTYFNWIDVDGNVLTQSVSDDRSDAALSLVAAPTLGTPPKLSLVASWRERLWGVDRADVDHLRFCETGQPWAWPVANDILIGREGSDARGISALLARRDALGVGKRDSLNQITGTGSRDFRSIVLSEFVGVESQETVVVYKDTAFFLWKDGVYRWDKDGIVCISDKKVRTWFVSDTYFNRDRFQNAFACVDPIRNKYCLFLAAVGSSVEDRWVEYDLDEGTWWGPHKTGAFTPVSAGMTSSSTDRFLRVIGSSNGFLWLNQATRTDDTATDIDMDVDTKRHDGGTPKIDKMFNELTLSLVPQTGGRLQVTPSVGELDAAAKTPSLQAELSESSHAVGRVGLGKSCKLNFRHNGAGRLVQILGYELDFFEVGQR